MTATEVLTPRVRTTARRSLFWVGALLLMLIVAAVAVSRSGLQQQAVRLDPESPSPQGARAVAEVLREQGVDVEITRDLESTLRGADGATVVLHDRDGILDTTRRDRLAASTDRLVLLEPGVDELEDLAPAVANAGSASEDRFEADCALPAVERAGEVVAGGDAYRVIDDSARTTGCLAGDDDTFSLVSVDAGGHEIVVFGLGDLLTNDVVGRSGNAALALNLLGTDDRLLWYVPSAADLDEESLPSLAQLTPRWATPAIALLFVTAFAAAMWRGRRLGPLVIENLPVTVRAGETMEGRARLYERNAARLRALDALRVGTVSRLAGALGLSRSASVHEVVTAAAELLGRPHPELRGLLLEAEPATDGELVALSDRLLGLEREVAERLDPRSIRPSQGE